MIDGIRKMLGFETKSSVFPVSHTALPSAFHPESWPSRTALRARWSKPHLTAGAWIRNSGGQLEFSRFVAQHVVVVVPPGFPFISAMRAPIAVGLVKSSGVPFTGRISPVGISVASTGVYLSAGR